MATIKANDDSSGRPVAGKRVIVQGCGRPAAMLRRSSRAESPQAELGHSVTVVGDIVGPVIPEEHRRGPWAVTASSLSHRDLTEYLRHECSGAVPCSVDAGPRGQGRSL